LLSTTQQQQQQHDSPRAHTLPRSFKSTTSPNNNNNDNNARPSRIDAFLAELDLLQAALDVEALQLRRKDAHTFATMTRAADSGTQTPPSSSSSSTTPDTPHRTPLAPRSPNRQQQQQQQQQQQTPTPLKHKRLLAPIDFSTDTPPRHTKAYRRRRKALLGLVKELSDEHQADKQQQQQHHQQQQHSPTTPRSMLKSKEKLSRDLDWLVQWDGNQAF
jgi:hypothetical protein